MKKTHLAALAIMLVTALIFGACAKPAPSSPAEIRIGTVGSLTGMFAGFGEGGVWGIKAAVDDVNKLGGVYVKEYGKKLPVKLIVVNSESDSIKAGSLAEDMVLRDKIQLFASGGEPPPVRGPVATIAERYKIPHVGVTAMEAWMAMRNEATPPWKYSWMYGVVIATPPPPGSIWENKPGFTLADIHPRILHPLGDQTNKKVAVFAMDDPDGRVTYEADAAMLKKEGFDPLYKGELGLFPPDTTDYSSMITAWKDNNAEILWGNAPAPHFGTLLRQAHALGFKPKMILAGKAALFYADVSSWGGDLPLGVQIEGWWDPAYDPKACPGIGDTTPMSLFERWTKDTGQPLNPNIGWSYPTVQILLDAVERAGTLDSDAVVKAISETDMSTINYRVKFDKETQFSWSPLFSNQWQKTDKPWVWESRVVLSEHDFIRPTAKVIFPIPYD